jgi:hypothetical protein
VFLPALTAIVLRVPQEARGAVPGAHARRALFGSPEDMRRVRQS